MPDEGYILPPIAGLPPPSGMGQSYLPERYSAPYEAVAPLDEPVIDKHPWKATRTEPNKFKVAGGKVFGRNGSSAEISDPLTVDTTDPAWVVWVKVTHTSGVVSAAEFGQGAVVPDDTEDTTYRPVVAFEDKAGGDVYLLINQIENAYIWISDTATSVNHMWKVTKGPQVDGLGAREWLIKEGVLYDGAVAWTVMDNAVNLTAGWIFLIVERDPDSREVTSVTIGTDETSISDSDETYQRIPVAYVDDESDDPPLQLLFEEVHTREELVVDNGEFYLDTFRMATRNKYTPPSP